MSASDKPDSYLSLTQSGKLFPSWINLNYKKFKLDSMFKKAGEDPCRPSKTDTGELKEDLRKYQLFVSQFLDYRSIYKSVLLFHGLGSF